MVDRDLEAKSRLVVLARKKAARRGTTLEDEVQRWLAQYVGEPDGEPAQQSENNSASRWSAPKAKITRAVESINKTKLPGQASRDTRSEAYRRLLGVMSDTTKRPS